MLILTSDVACSSARVLVISQLQFYMVFLKLTKVRARPHSRARGYYIEAYLQRSKKSKRKRITSDLFFASKCDAENYIPEYLASFGDWESNRCYSAIGVVKVLGFCERVVVS